MCHSLFSKLHIFMPSIDLPISKDTKDVSRIMPLTVWLCIHSFEVVELLILPFT